MTDPADKDTIHTINRLKSLRFLTALSLFIENCVFAIWLPACWMFLFFGLWMWNATALVGETMSSIMLVIFFIGLAVLLKPVFKQVRWPDRHKVNRRLEQHNNLKHRPIETLEDRLINPEKPETRRLWAGNKARAILAIQGLKSAKPNISLSDVDPHALRFAAVIILLTGFVAAGSDWQGRILAGLKPYKGMEATEQASKYTIWITPPAYTGLKQIVLQENTPVDEAVDIVEGSSIKIRITGGWTIPRYSVDKNSVALQKLEEDHWSLETMVTDGTLFKVSQLPFTTINVPYNFIKDMPPVIELVDAPTTLEHGELRPKLKITDDFGTRTLTVRVSLAPNVEATPFGNDYEETRILISPPGTEMDIEPVFDLAWHPWAGLPVVLNFEVSDYPGHVTALAPLTVTLPERTFTDPLAKKLVDMRKRLIWTPDAAARNVSYELSELLYNPSQMRNDPVVFLGVRTAASRLHYARNKTDVGRVIELLWDVAIRQEDGNLPHAARTLREARENLENLLNDPNASDAEIAQATQELQEALGQYFQELMRELQKRMAQSGNNIQMMPQNGMQNLITPEDIASFLDQLKAEALSGDKSKALELLSELQQFMDKIDPSLNSAMPPQMEFMMQGINELQELIEKQKALLEETRQIIQNNMPRAPKNYGEFLTFEESILKKWGFEQFPPPPMREPEPQDEPHFNTKDKQTEQDALRFVLGQLMMDADEQLGEIPQKMQMAEQEMRGSGSMLSDNDPVRSIPHQEKALQYLQDSMQDMSQQMQQMMKSMAMMALGGMKLDPLGRPMNEGNGQSPFPGSTVKIPDEGQRKRAEEILQELRERSGEFDRPDYELEYYKRLLKQF